MGKLKNYKGFDDSPLNDRGMGYRADPEEESKKKRPTLMTRI
jgi:hypothetical protein